MAGYVETFKSKMNWGNVLERAQASPLDRSSMFGSYDDAVLYAIGDGSDSRGFGATSYIGQIITVYENDKVDTYRINANRELESIGGGTVTVENYEEAIEVATVDNIGQIVFVKNKTYSYEEEVSGETVVEYTTNDAIIPEGVSATTFDAGAYIVTGNGDLQKLAQSSASGDIAGDLTTLQTRVGNLELTVNNYHTIGGDDIY